MAPEMHITQPDRSAPSSASGVRLELAYRALCAVQGLYYLLTGLWPLLSIATFQQVTGRKYDNLPTGLEADHWLVNTVAVLIAAIAVTILASAALRTPQIEIVLLCFCSAVGLTTIDVVYVTRKVIRPIYLVDAAVEVPLILLWLVFTWRLMGRVRSLRLEA